MTTGGIPEGMGMSFYPYGTNVINLVVELYFSFSRCRHWGKLDK